MRAEATTHILAPYRRRRAFSAAAGERAALRLRVPGTLTVCAGGT